MILKHHFPWIIWAVVIFVLSGYPGDKMPPDPFINFDKLAHSGVYALLSFLLCNGFIRQYSKVFSRYKIVLLLSLFFSIFYGGLMEILQQYIFINRRGDWIDFGADVLGSIIGAVAAHYILNRKHSPK